MKQSVNVLAPSGSDFLSVIEHLPLAPYNLYSLDFTKQLSALLLNVKKTEFASDLTTPDLVALGFWLRPSNINKIRQDFALEFAKPLGVVSHFTPANVDTMFVYSWICSLLMGNNNVVRVASKNTPAADLLMGLINQLLCKPEHIEIANRNQFVTYDKSSRHSQDISTVSDARVIWGGDDSVLSIRSLTTKPRCRDISFADRYSASLIDARSDFNDDNVTSVAKALWKDTQPFAQQACSSPRVIFWMGDESLLHHVLVEINKLAKQTTFEITQKNNQLVNQQLVKTTHPNNNELFSGHITALAVENLSDQLLQWHTGEGIFYVLKIDTEDELVNHADAKLQTLSYWGVDKAALLKLCSNPSISGIDRIVPIGRALDFSPTWDGFDLFSQLTRKIDLILL